MTNTLVPAIRQPNQARDFRDFSYVNHRDNFPLAEIRRTEEDFIKVALTEPTQLSVIQNTALTSPKPKTDLPLTSDYGNVGYEHLLSARGPIRQALMWA